MLCLLISIRVWNTKLVSQYDAALAELQAVDRIVEGGLTDLDTVDWPIFRFLPRFRAVFRYLQAHSAWSWKILKSIFNQGTPTFRTIAFWHIDPT